MLAPMNAARTPNPKENRSPTRRKAETDANVSRK
jgi:hypothetical protein